MPKNWNKLVTIQEAVAAYAAGDDLDAHCFLYAGDRVKPYRETVSGDIVTLPPYDPPLTLYTQTGRFVDSLIADIVPVQSGSGDPSPDNIRPISGWTGANIYNDPVYGGIIDWNQLMYGMRGNSAENGLTFINENNALTITGTITESFAYNAIPFTANTVPFKRDGSKYLIMLNKEIPFEWGVSGYNAIVSPGNRAGIWSNNSGGVWSNGLAFRAYVRQTVNIHELKASVFDLTQMFGSTIADYIYQLEQSTAGAGIAWFRTLFPKDYYPYNTGEKTCVSAVNGDNYNKYTITFPTGTGTVYGGRLDVTNGELTVTDAMIDSYNGETLPSTWISDRDVYAEDTTPTIGAQVVYKLAEPLTYQLTPTEVKLLEGENNLFADTGSITLTYVETREEI